MGEKLPQNADDWLDVVPEDDDWTYYTDHRGVAFPERSVVEQLQIYVPPLLLITGTIGNILSAIVLWKFIQKVLSTCLYLFVVQISDLIVLYLLCGNIWFDTLTGLDIRKKAMLSNNSVCKYYVLSNNSVCKYYVLSNNSVCKYYVLSNNSVCKYYVLSNNSVCKYYVLSNNSVCKYYVLSNNSVCKYYVFSESNCVFNVVFVRITCSIIELCVSRVQ